MNETDEKAIYDNSGTNQNQPTTSESGTAEEQGGNKHDPMSVSPSAGKTIVGRDVASQSAVTDAGSYEEPLKIDSEHSPDE